MPTNSPKSSARSSIKHGRLLVATGSPRPAAWAVNVWLNPREIAIASISDAAAQLRARQRNWAFYAPELYRRATLIQEQLPKVSAKPVVFGLPPPTAPLGSWTLLDAGTMLVATHCTSAFPNGEIRFVEDRSGPPSRAYLKLWEALTLIGRQPGPGEKCLDLGSSPGGWSWVLQRLGAHVVSVDKAPLAPAVARLPGIEHRLDSAFALDPAAVGPIDLAVFGCRLLPDAALGTRRALARRRDLPQFRLHDQVPGRNRSCRYPPFRRHSRLATAPSISQQARIDLEQNRVRCPPALAGRTRWNSGCGDARRW